MLAPAIGAWLALGFLAPQTATSAPAGHVESRTLESEALAGVEALHDLLASQDVPHVIDAYDGTHNDVLRQRMKERVLPLLASVLAPAGG